MAKSPDEQVGPGSSKRAPFYVQTLSSGWLNLAPILLSAFAVLISAESYKLTRDEKVQADEHSKLMARPIPQLEIEHFNDTVTLRLTNKGLSTAFFEHAYIYVDDQPPIEMTATWRDTMTATTYFKTHFEAHGYPIPTSYIDISWAAATPTDDIEVIKFENVGEKADLAEEFLTKHVVIECRYRGLETEFAVYRYNPQWEPVIPLMEGSDHGEIDKVAPHDRPVTTQPSG